MGKYTKLEKWEMLNKLDAKDDCIAKLKAQLKKQQDAIHEALQCKCLDAGLCDDCCNLLCVAVKSSILIGCSNFQNVEWLN